MKRWEYVYVIKNVISKSLRLRVCWFAGLENIYLDRLGAAQNWISTNSIRWAPTKIELAPTGLTGYHPKSNWSQLNQLGSNQNSIGTNVQLKPLGPLKIKWRQLNQLEPLEIRANWTHWAPPKIKLAPSETSGATQTWIGVNQKKWSPRN